MIGTKRRSPCQTVQPIDIDVRLKELKSQHPEPCPSQKETCRGNQRTVPEVITPPDERTLVSFFTPPSPAKLNFILPKCEYSSITRCVLPDSIRLVLPDASPGSINSSLNSHINLWSSGNRIIGFEVAQAYRALHNQLSKLSKEKAAAIS